MATVTSLGRTHTTTAGNKTFTGTSVTGDFIVVVTVSTGVATSAVSDNDGGTYVQVGTTRTGFSTSGNLQMWVRTTLVASGKSTIYTATQASSTGGGLQVLRVTGVTVLSSAAVRSTGGQSSGTAGTTPAPVLSNTPLSHNVIIAAVANGTNGSSTVTERSGYTEAGDSGYNTPATGFEVCFRNSGETSATLTFGSTTATAFASYGIELISNRTLTADAGSYTFTGNSATLKRTYRLVANSGSFTLTGNSATTSKNSPPTVSLNTPADAATSISTEPTLNFTGTDPEGDTLEYNVQIHTDSTFNRIADNYSESNTQFGESFSTNVFILGQSFTGVDGKLNKATFYINKLNGAGEPLGNITAVLYAHSGTFGTSSIGTGSVLATSTAKTATSISTSLSLVDFDFDGTYTLISGTKYIIGLEYTSGTFLRTIAVGTDDTTLSHSGNRTIKNNSDVWSATSDRDTPFYVYTTPSINKVSETDSGFTAGHPFTSGVAKEFTVQPADNLTSLTTYYWRVRAKDPSGTNTYGAWSSTRSFTTQSNSVSLTASSGSYTLTGNTVNLKKGYKLIADSGLFSLTGNAVATRKTYQLVATSTSFAFTGNATATRKTYILTANAGSYSLTLNNATLAKGYRLVANAGSYTLTGNDASLKRALKLVAASTSYTLTGNSTGLTKGYRLVANATSYTFTGNNANLTAIDNKNIIADSGTYTLTGNNATLTAANAETLVADSGSYSLTGNNAGLVRSHILVAGSGSLTFTGNSVSTTKTSRLVADSGSFTFTGNSAGLVKSYILIGDAGSYIFTGNNVTLTYTPTSSATPSATLYLPSGTSGWA